MGGLRSDSRSGSLLQKGELPHPSIPLHDLPHRLISEVRNEFTADLASLVTNGEVPEGKRFSLGHNPRGGAWPVRWSKARADDERGLVCLASSQFWLGWAGMRRENYQSFNGERHAAGNTLAFEPTNQDWDRLRLELAWTANELASDSWRTLMIESIVNGATESFEMRAAEAGALAVPPPLPDNIPTVCIGRCSVAVETEIDATFVRFDVHLDNPAWFDEVLGIVTTSIPGHDDLEQCWDLDLDYDSIKALVMLDPQSLDRLKRAVDQFGAASITARADLLADPDDGHSHLAQPRAINRALVQGQLLRALCGHSFVPSRLPDQFPVCDDCAVIAAALNEIADDS